MDGLLTVLTQPSLRAVSERESCLSLILRTLISLDQGSTHMTSFNLNHVRVFPGDSDGKRICLQRRRLGFDAWVRKIPWKRKWQPTPALLPGESHGQRGLVGYSPRGLNESDTTERLTLSRHFTLSKVFSLKSGAAKHAEIPRVDCRNPVSLAEGRELPGRVSERNCVGSCVLLGLPRWCQW